MVVEQCRSVLKMLLGSCDRSDVAFNYLKEVIL